jgi:hypothetical protein
MFAAFVSPLYIFMMRWLTGWQRVYLFALIGGALVALSLQLSRTLPAQVGPYDLLYHFRALSVFALTYGWFICGFFHALILSCRGWGLRQALQATPQLSQP